MSIPSSSSWITGAAWEELAASDNRFAVVVMAHLKMLETRGDGNARRRWKFSLVRGLYERGLGRDEIAELFRVIDWLMALPDDLEQGFWDELREHEEEKQMPYVTSVERIGYRRGKEEGLQQGLQQGLQEGLLAGIEFGLSKSQKVRPRFGKVQEGQSPSWRGFGGVPQNHQKLCDTYLELKFGVDGLRLLPEISRIDDLEVLKAVQEALKVANSLDELRRIYRREEG